ncbi:hypothetical protein ACHAXT_005674 [Thalassiosira profunda]
MNAIVFLSSLLLASPLGVAAYTVPSGGKSAARSAARDNRRAFLSNLAGGAAAMATLGATPGRSLAADAPQEEVYFGAGCFWHVQHEFVQAERNLLGRKDNELTSLTGYAGGTKAGSEGRVCYHNFQSVADYGKLGHGEVVGMRIPQSSIGDFAVEYFKLFGDKGERADPMDKGGEYRSLLGLPGGKNHPMYGQVEAAAKARGMTLADGRGNDPDTLGKRLVYVYDTKAFPFYQAEVSYGKQYNELFLYMPLYDGYDKDSDAEEDDDTAKMTSIGGTKAIVVPPGKMGIHVRFPGGDITAIRPTSPFWGKVLPGDRVVAIDGRALTKGEELQVGADKERRVEIVAVDERGDEGGCFRDSLGECRSVDSDDSLRISKEWSSAEPRSANLKAIWDEEIASSSQALEEAGREQEKKVLERGPDAAIALRDQVLDRYRQSCELEQVTATTHPAAEEAKPQAVEDIAAWQQQKEAEIRALMAEVERLKGQKEERSGDKALGRKTATATRSAMKRSESVKAETALEQTPESEASQLSPRVSFDLSQNKEYRHSDDLPQPGWFEAMLINLGCVGVTPETAVVESQEPIASHHTQPQDNDNSLVDASSASPEDDHDLTPADDLSWEESISTGISSIMGMWTEPKEEPEEEELSYDAEPKEEPEELSHDPEMQQALLRGDTVGTTKKRGGLFKSFKKTSKKKAGKQILGRVPSFGRKKGQKEAQMSEIHSLRSC